MEDTSESCRWIHEQLEQLTPPIRFPFALKDLPVNGIYFFYQDSEIWGHGSNRPRVVRIGTHKDGNFRSRINEHFLLNESSKMNFDLSKSTPHDRSIFRKNIGRALLKKENEDYLKIWNRDFMTERNRIEYGHLRDISIEKRIESRVTKTLRESFSFKFLLVENEAERIGSKGLESRLIGTIANCSDCQPSIDWLGRYSPVRKISEGRMWLVQHINSPPIDETDKETISQAVDGMKKRVSYRK